MAQGILMLKAEVSVYSIRADAIESINWCGGGRIRLREGRSYTFVDMDYRNYYKLVDVWESALSSRDGGIWHFNWQYIVVGK